jgi:hypothetical protein
MLQLRAGAGNSGGGNNSKLKSPVLGLEPGLFLLQGNLVTGPLDGLERNSAIRAVGNFNFPVILDEAQFILGNCAVLGFENIKKKNFFSASDGFPGDFHRSDPIFPQIAFGEAEKIALNNPRAKRSRGNPVVILHPYSSSRVNENMPRIFFKLRGFPGNLHFDAVNSHYEFIMN